MNVFRSSPAFVGSFPVLRGIIEQDGKRDFIAVVAVFFLIICFVHFGLQIVVVRDRIVVAKCV